MSQMVTDVVETRARKEPTGEVLMINANAVARMVGCSWRTVYRLSDQGRMPPPLKVGSLTRWRLKEIEHWIEKGCHPVRPRPSTGVKKGGAVK